jgi:hypothetical protein
MTSRSLLIRRGEALADKAIHSYRHGALPLHRLHSHHWEDLHHHHHTRGEGTRILKASTSISIVIIINNVSITDSLCILVVISNPIVDVYLYSFAPSYSVHINVMMLIAFICE